MKPKIMENGKRKRATRRERSHDTKNVTTWLSICCGRWYHIVSGATNNPSLSVKLIRRSKGNKDFKTSDINECERLELVGI